MAQNNKEQTTSANKPFGLNLLDNLIGEDGIKTDLKIGLTNSTYFKLGTTIVISLAIVIAILTISFYIHKPFNGSTA